MPEENDEAVERVANLLRDELYDTLEDAAGAGDSFDYIGLAKRVLKAEKGG